MTDTGVMAVASPAGVNSLEDLFEALRLELEAMIGEQPALVRLFEPSFLDICRRAYFEEVVFGVRELIEAAAAAEAAGEPDARLVEHGLTGAQLEAKLELVKRRMIERNAILERVTDGRAPSLLGLAQKKVLEAIDLILDSFAGALKLGGAVAEFKKLLEHAL